MDELYLYLYPINYGTFEWSGIVHLQIECFLGRGLGFDLGVGFDAHNRIIELRSSSYTC